MSMKLNYLDKIVRENLMTKVIADPKVTAREVEKHIAVVQDLLVLLHVKLSEIQAKESDGQ